MMADLPRLVQWTVRVYEMLILVYPASFRQKYGSEMAIVFRESALDAWRKRGVIGIFAVCLRVLPDLVRTVPAEHVAEWTSQKGESTMSLKSLLTRKIGPDNVSPGWARLWILLFSFVLMALYIKALTNMKLATVELLFGVLLIAAMTLQGISYGLLIPVFHRTNSSMFKSQPSQIAVYAASLIVMVLGIRTLASMVLTEFQLFIGVLLSLNVMMNGCFVAAILPLIRADRAQAEPPRAKQTLTDL
jgi:hypothetical protein